MTLRSATCIALLFLTLPLAARAQSEDSCQAAEPLSGQRLLRRLSLDLRGKLPSYEEALAQRGLPEVPAATVDAFLDSPDFLDVMARYHATLLWPNIDQADIFPETHVLYPYEPAPGDVLYLSALRSVFVRAAGPNLYLPCKNEPARFDAQGRPIAEPILQGNEIVGYQEGYVLVEPYWAPGTQVKVCAFDAQEFDQAEVCPGPTERYPFVEPFCQNVQQFAELVSAPFRGSEVACDGPLAIFAPNCGCGPRLERCNTPETARAVRQSMLAQELRLVERVIRDEEPYSAVLSSKVVDLNGPLAHFLRHQSRLSFDYYGAQDASSPLPEDLRYADGWRPIVRSGRHAGVLTTPGYLLRFQANRGRAHRYYNAFECSSFIPAGPLPSPFEPCSQHEDLTKRCGCDACHKALEPLAAHWGRFAEYGLSPIDDAAWPVRAGANCTPPLGSVTQLFYCVRFYELDPVGEEEAYRGVLNPYVFRPPSDVENIEAGPSKLVQDAVSSGRFSACTARKMWTELMRRPPTPEEEERIIPGLVQTFDASGKNLKALVKAIVTHPAYARMP